MTLALRGVVNDKRKITKWDDNEIFTSSNDCRCCHERIEEKSKYCKYVTFHIWYKKFKTTKICSINYGAFQNIVRSQLPKNTARYDSCSWSINAQWMHSVNKFCSQEIAGDGQRFELQSCRQMLPCGRPGSRIPRVPDLWLQGCQIVTALCSWRKEFQILGLNVFQLCTCSKKSWSVRKLVLQR